MKTKRVLTIFMTGRGGSAKCTHRASTVLSNGLGCRLECLDCGYVRRLTVAEANRIFKGTMT